MEPSASADTRSKKEAVSANKLKRIASDLLLKKRKRGLREVEQMKKLLLIALVAGGFAFTTVPRTEARGFVSVGIGFPIGGYYGGCGPGYGYGYSGYYPYGYSRPYYSRVGYGYYNRPYYSRPYYWHHGRRIYHGRRCR